MCWGLHGEGFPALSFSPPQPIPPSTGWGTVPVRSGVPSPAPCADPEGSAAGCRGLRGARAGVQGRRVDAAVGSDAAAGPGGLVTAACRERPPSAPRQPGRARHKANAAPGRSPPPWAVSPSAGMQGRDTQGWGAQSRAVGLDGQQVAGGGVSQLCSWQRPCGWQSVDVASRPWASDPHGKQPQRRDLGGCRRHQSWQRVPGQEGSPQDHGGLRGRHLLSIPKG